MLRVPLNAWLSLLCLHTAVPSGAPNSITGRGVCSCSCMLVAWRGEATSCAS
jgi:hypothetical protein